MQMASIPDNVGEAFRAGIHAYPYGPFDHLKEVMHFGTEPPGENLSFWLFTVRRWPSLEPIDDRENAYRVGRAFRASPHYLDVLGVPLNVGKDILDSVIRMGNLHMKMHAGVHRFGPGHVIEAVVNALGPFGPYPTYLQTAGISQEQLATAIWAYVKSDEHVLPPLVG